MINQIIRYVHYMLAILLIVLIFTGKSMVSFLVGAAVIYIVLYGIKLFSFRSPKSKSNESPYRILVSAAKPTIIPTTEQKASSKANLGDTDDGSADDAENFEDFDENYDLDSDTYDDYSFDTDENTSEGQDNMSQQPEDSVGIEYRKAKLERLLSLTSKIPRMGGIEFEEFLRDLYDVLGYTVHTTDINDQGADLIVMYQNEKIVIQAKRYKSKVSNSAVQQVYTAKAFYDCDKAIVITNSEFTKSAREVAEKVGVELWDSKSLHSMLSSMKTMFSKP